MDKIADTIRIDCFTISTVTLKSIIEEHLERLSDALILALKRKIMDEKKNIQQFLEEALEKLNVRPNSVSELGKAQSEFTKLQDRQNEIDKMKTAADEKNKMLRMPRENGALALMLHTHFLPKKATKPWILR